MLVSNETTVGITRVNGGTLRINEGRLDVAGMPVTFAGLLKSNTVAVNGSSSDVRAAIAGSSGISATNIKICRYGSLLGNAAGRFSLYGNVELQDGATIELGAFKSHYNQTGATNIYNPYFSVQGSLSTAALGNTINLNDDAIDPGVYRVLTSNNAITGGGFKLGSIGAFLPPGSVTLTTTGDGKNVDLLATTGRVTLRFWNATQDKTGTSTWTVDGNDWSNSRQGNIGTLNPTGTDSVMAVFGYTGSPQQNGTINVQSKVNGSLRTDNKITHGMQFLTDGWQLNGDALELKGGAAWTEYMNWSTLQVTTGNVTINNVLYGNAGLRVAGAGNLTLTGENSYWGSTKLVGGTLNVAKDANLGAASGSIKLEGGKLALGPSFGSTARAIAVSGNGETTSTINLGGSRVAFNGGLTGNGLLVLENGHAAFAGNNRVNFSSGTLNVGSGAALSVNGEGYIRAANVSGTLYGSFGSTLSIKSLNLASTAEIKLTLPSTNAPVAAFKGSSAQLNGQITQLNLPEGYSVGSNSKSLYVFDYLDRSGQITISENVIAQYANSDFTFGGLVNGYLVLNSKFGPQTDDNPTINVDTQARSNNWTEAKFVTGQAWNNGTATFTGDGTNKPIPIEGNVRIAGLVVNGPGFKFGDAGVSGAPGAFLLQPAAGNTVVNLAVGTNGSATISVPLGGAGFAKTGEGLLVLSGNSGEYAGTGTVQGGALHVSGNFSNASFTADQGVVRVNGAARQVTVNAGGAVEGLYVPNATSPVNIGTLVVNGGKLKPGNSPGTIRLGGLSQTAGAIEFERGDMIEVLRGVGGTPNGQAVFSKANDGSRVQLQLVDSRGYTFGNTYAFVTAQNGVTFITPDAVQVSEVNNGRLFSSFQVEAVGTNGNFYLQRNRGFATEAWTPNQAAVAIALESKGTNGRASVSPIYNAIASASSYQAYEVRAAFDQLSGEIHPSAQAVLVDESRYLREATANRTRAALKGNEKASGQSVYALKDANLAMWGQAYGSWGDTHSTANSSKLDRSIGGFLLGFDTGIYNNWRLGIAGGYAKSEIDAKSNLSKAKVDNYNLAIYGGGQFGALGLRMGAGYTWHRLDTTRELAALGLRDGMSAKYDARTFQMYGEGGYELKFDFATVEPFLNLAYVQHESDNMLERDLGLGAGLRGFSSSMSTSFSTLGLRLARDFETNGAKGTVRSMLGWRQAFGDVDARWRLLGSSLPVFSAGGAPIARNAVALGVGVDVEIAKDTTFGVSYNGQISNHTQDHGLRGNFAIKF